MPNLSTTLERIRVCVDLVAAAAPAAHRARVEQEMLARLTSALRFDETGDTERVALAALFDTRRPTGARYLQARQAWKQVVEPFGPGGDPAHHVPHARRVAALIERGWDGNALFEAALRSEAARHTRLVWQQANKLATWAGASAEDLFGWGWIGLCAALRLYNPATGNAFSTYAATRITGHMRDGLRTENPVPKRLATFYNKANAITVSLEETLGRPPTLEEVAERLEVTVEYLEVLPRLARAASLDELTEAGQELDDVPTTGLGDPDSSSIEDAAIGAALRHDIAAALETLDPRTAAVIRHVLLENRSLAECRRLTGLPVRRIHEHLEHGQARLAEALAGWAVAA